MKKHACPVCEAPIPLNDLRYDRVHQAPRRFGLAWPRAYCPFCSAQLRNDYGAMTTYVLLMGPGLISIGACWFYDGGVARLLGVLGSALVCISGLVAVRSHRLVAVETHDPADGDRCDRFPSS